MQTLKSALESRVRIDYTQWNAAARQQGHFYDTCPADSHNLMNDIYGRPVNQNTLNMADASCNAHAPHPQTVNSRIQIENDERPYIPLAGTGMRGAGDLMGKGRDLFPQDLYGNGNRGNFVKYGNCGLQLPKPQPQLAPPIYDRRQQQVHLPSHDTTSPYLIRT